MAAAAETHVTGTLDDNPRGAIGTVMGTIPGANRSLTCTPAANEKYLDVGITTQGTATTNGVVQRFGRLGFEDVTSAQNAGFFFTAPDGSITCTGSVHSTGGALANPGSYTTKGTFAWTRIPMCESQPGEDVKITVTVAPAAVYRTESYCPYCGSIWSAGEFEYLWGTAELPGAIGFETGRYSWYGATLGSVRSGVGKPAETCDIALNGTTNLTWGTLTPEQLANNPYTTLKKIVTMSVSCTYRTWGNRYGTPATTVKDTYTMTSGLGLVAASSAHGGGLSIRSDLDGLGFQIELNDPGRKKWCNTEKLGTGGGCVLPIGNTTGTARTADSIPSTTNPTVEQTYGLYVYPVQTSEYNASAPPVGVANATFTLQHWYSF